MNACGNLAIVSVLLQLSVPSYALRLVRRFGAQRVGWFLVAAFSSLALLHFLRGSIGSAGVGTDILYVSVSFLLLIGMGHLDTLCACRRLAARRARARASDCGQQETGCLAEELTTESEVLEEAAPPIRTPFDVLELAAKERLKKDSMRKLAGWTGQMVNNAVTAIRGQADSLRQKPQDTATLQQLEAISTAAKRASGFTRQLLLLGGQYRLQRELVDLNQVLQSQYWKLKGVLRDQVELREFLSPTLPAVIADTRLLEHIAVNLVVLIGGSIPGAGSVIITTRPIRIGREHARRARGGRTGNFVCLSFGSGADCVGSRLPAGVADQTTSANLRLASVEAAVEELFGWTELSTNASSGSEVRVYLPSVRVSRKTAFACGTTEPVCA